MQALEQASPGVDQDFLKKQIRSALSVRYAPRRWESPEGVAAQDASDIRGWLLAALGRVADGDVAALELMEKHLDPSHEPDEWVRHWALEGLYTADAPDLLATAQRVARKKADESALVRNLALVILASRKDDAALEKVRDSLRRALDGAWRKADEAEVRGILRALRVVRIEDLDVLDSVGKIIGNRKYSDAAIYDAIFALGRLRPQSHEAEVAEGPLRNTIVHVRRWTMYDAMRKQAIESLGNLRIERTADLLLEEMTDANVAIACAASQALEKVVGPEVATVRVVEKIGREELFSATKRYAMALRHMEDHSAVGKELESLMESGPESHQQAARLLLLEFGGPEAFQRLKARTWAIKDYIKTMARAERKVRLLFESSIEEARKGFKLATLMDLSVFAVGLLLIVLSGIAALLGQTGAFSAWAGAAGGIGVLGVLYGILIGNPRRQIPQAVNQLMEIKVIFLGYLRQLHQSDQAYTRHLFESKEVSTRELGEFKTLISSSMSETIELLNEAREGETEEVRAEEKQPSHQIH